MGSIDRKGKLRHSARVRNWGFFDKVARANRVGIISRIAQQRGSTVLCHLTADRPTRVAVGGMSTALAGEAQPWLIEHLRQIGRVKQIDLLLYTRGGNTDSVWPIVSAIREYCERFCVLVPFRAHSAGTLVCLGADETAMSPEAEFSPIDPTTGNPFNPVDELVPGSRKGISVEDVTAYIALARDKKKAGLKKEASILEVFKKLADHVHPLALGNVNRGHTQIRLLGRKLLQLPAGRLGESQITEIVDMLTEKLSSHLHAINRHEARAVMGNRIAFADGQLEKDMWDLFQDFAGVMQLKERFNVLSYMGNQLVRTIDVYGGFIESANLSTVFVSRSRISLRSALPAGANIQIQAAGGQVQPLPLIPCFPVEISVEPVEEGWQDNAGGA